jgi:hypothetical protein
MAQVIHAAIASTIDSFVGRNACSSSGAKGTGSSSAAMRSGAAF